ncbi:MAG: winged helix-turn-helix domain-containing protein [archaeon]
MNEITIGKEEFRALSSDTRISIVKLLNQRNYTLSELSAKLSMSSPTIKQHLETLVNSDLIEQKDEGRKWKYYCLTRKGKKLLRPESTPNVMILLVTSVLGIMFLVYMLFGTGIDIPMLAAEQGTEKMNANDSLAVATGATEYTTKESARNTDETIQPDSGTGNGFPAEKTGIILALIAVSFIAGFLASKATKKRQAI